MKLFLISLMLSSSAYSYDWYDIVGHGEFVATDKVTAAKAACKLAWKDLHCKAPYDLFPAWRGESRCVRDSKCEEVNSADLVQFKCSGQIKAVCAWW